ncbi:DNA polymerase Y family protein [Myxococcota bacterium]|nr:DNA polymerase Y family protein [Myxococcota bacterium]
MFRYLVAHLPAFRLERCGWLHSQPAALVAEEKSALRVQCATPAALSGGVRRGMTAAEARAVLPALQVETLQPEDEARDLDDLAQQLLRVSPSVRALPPDALVAEISRVGAPGASSAPRAGAERALLERVRLRLAQLGHRVTVVVADDPATAWACAAWGRQSRVVPAGQGAEALAPLPLEALDLPPREQALLRGLGLRTVGAFAALPPASVVGRLGPVAIAAHALARGDAPRPAIPPWQQDQPLVLTQPLMHPVVEQEALLFVLNGLLRDAAAHLVAADRAAVRLLLRLGLDPQEDGADDGASARHGGPTPHAPGGVQELPLRLGAPTRDPRRMLELLRARLERLRLAGPVISVSLELPDPVEFTGRQRDLLDRQRAAEALDEVVARLQDELGADAVLRPQLAPRHRPEAAWQPQPWSSPRPSLLSSSGRAAPACHADQLGRQRPDGSDPVRAWEGFPAPPSPVRPTLLLLPAQSVELRTRPLGPGLGEQPVQLHVDGRWHDLTDLAGPEALAGEWWRDGFDRRYWRATLGDGRRAWLYLEEGHWALHGWFD